MKRSVNRAVCLLLVLAFTAALAGCVPMQEGMAEDPVVRPGTSAVSSSVPDDVCNHYYDRLSPTVKAAYDIVYPVITDFPERIRIPTLTNDELEELFAALMNDNPAFFFLTGASTLRTVNSTSYLYPGYQLDVTDYTAMYRKCNEIAAPILERARAEATPFGRERVVHDSLIAMCDYSNSSSNTFRGTIYGLLCGGQAACEGYAKTAKFLLDQLGIPCYVISGYGTTSAGETESHMWNAVQLDGDWYYLDVTWDDPIVKSGEKFIRYEYFNITEQALRLDHADYDADNTFAATACNFFVHEDLLFTQFGDAEKERALAYAADVLSLGSDGFQLCFADKASYQSARKALLDDGGVFSLLKLLAEQIDRPIETDRYSYSTTDDKFIIEIIPVS